MDVRQMKDDISKGQSEEFGMFYGEWLIKTAESKANE